MPTRLRVIHTRFTIVSLHYTSAALRLHYILRLRLLTLYKVLPELVFFRYASSGVDVV